MTNTVNQSYTYSDINPTLAINPFTGDLVLQFDSDAIKGSITNLVMGKKYERPFLSDITCGIEQDLFEMVDEITAGRIQDKIEATLTSYEPRIENVTVNVAPDDTQNGYTVTVIFLPRDSLQVQTVTLFLQRVI